LFGSYKGNDDLGQRCGYLSKEKRAALEHDYASALIKLDQGAPSIEFNEYIQ
jgi:hypothetical protein